MPQKLEHLQEKIKGEKIVIVEKQIMQNENHLQAAVSLFLLSFFFLLCFHAFVGVFRNCLRLAYLEF